MAAYFVFFYEMVSQVCSQEEKGEAQKTKFVVLPGPRARRRAPRGHVGGPQGGREAEDRVGGAWAMTFTGVSEEKTGRAGQTGQDLLVWMFWGTRSYVVCSQRNCFLGRLGSGSISLHTKGTPSLGPLSPLSLS